MRSPPDFAAERAAMVERQLRRRGITDERVLKAMEAVPRELFVPDAERRRAYNDSALPIGEGQTISQPWIVAAICQALALLGEEHVLEIGTGSGYSAAVLARLAGDVVTVERLDALAAGARGVLAELGATNVEVIVADGTTGVPERAPYDGIAVHATAPDLPATLIDQLAVGGRLVVPIATDGADMLTVFVRVDEHVDTDTGAGLERHNLGGCRFVPLIGREGFEEERRRRWIL